MRAARRPGFTSDLHDGFSTFPIIRFLFQFAFPAFHRRGGEYLAPIDRSPARENGFSCTRARIDIGKNSWNTSGRALLIVVSLQLNVYPNESWRIIRLNVLRPTSSIFFPCYVRVTGLREEGNWILCEAISIANVDERKTERKVQMAWTDL